MMAAGESARERYERGRAKHRAGRGVRLLINMLIGVPVAAIAASFTASQGYDFGPLLAFLILVIAFAKAWIEPDHVRAWGIGAHGESITERELERLPDGYEILHDRRLPGSRGNVDHVAVGPGGVFVVESKRMAGKLSIRRDEVFIRGRRTGMVDQVLHQVETIERVLEAAGHGAVPVLPVLFIQKADAPWLVGRPLGVVIVLSGRQLRRRIIRSTPLLEKDAVSRVAGVLDRALRPMRREATAAPAPTKSAGEPSPVFGACPRCGNEMVLRRNGQRQAFLGCSQFPKCRGTRAWSEGA